MKGLIFRIIETGKTRKRESPVATNSERTKYKYVSKYLQI